MRFLILAAAASVVLGHDDHDHGMNESMMLEQAKEDFKQIDENGDGKLDLDELMKFVEDENAKPEVEDFIQKADTDNDGQVSEAEYIQFVVSMYGDYHDDHDHYHEEDHDEWDDDDEEWEEL